MKNKPSSSRNKSPAGNPAPSGTWSTRRRFLRQTLAAGAAGVGVGVPGAAGQTPGSRAKPHTSPPGKKNHKDKLPKPSKKLKESMEWDFERFLAEVIDQIIKGKKPDEIEEWIRPKGSTVKKRQIVKTEEEEDEPPVEKEHPLGVCLACPIAWVMDENGNIGGFIIHGRLGRKLDGEPLECDEYEFPPENKTAEKRLPGAQALVFSRRAANADPKHRLVANYPGGSSSSSSSSSHWPKP